MHMLALRRAAARCTACLLALLLGGCLTPPPDPAPVVRGPVPTRIIQPAALIFPAPRPRRATVLEPGERLLRGEFIYSSIFEFDTGPGEEALFDGEIARLGADLRFGLAPAVELSVEPSFLFASAGFMDRFVDAFHELTGFSEGGRNFNPRNEYTMRLGTGDVTAFELAENEVGFADLPVGLTVQLRGEDDDGPAVALRGIVELPTGDEASGVGSGGVDLAADLMVERSAGRWSGFGSVGGVFAETPTEFRRAGIDVRTMLHVTGGVEYRWSDRLSLLGQAVLRMPLTRSFTLEEIDKEILDLGFGLAYDIAPGVALTGTFHEDAVAASGPDLTFYFGLTLRP